MDKRIMVAELDSIAQQEVFDAATDRAAAVRAISGWLRSALVLSGRILVTDSMLLDGRYFMELGPEGVARELGASVRDLPLTICGVQPTLRAGLEQKLAQPGFEWQLHYGLSTRPDKPAKHHRRVWEKWLLALDEGSITYVCVLPPSPIGPNGHPGLPLDPGPLVDDLPMDTEFLHFSPEIRGFAEESMEFTSRSVFVGRLAEAMSHEPATAGGGRPGSCGT